MFLSKPIRPLLIRRLYSMSKLGFVRRRVCGIDEAGRGPLMGPLVIAGVVLPEGMHDLLRELGVKDSKKILSREKRESLHAFITTHADIGWASTHVTSQEIDLRRRRNETLNDIESSAMLALARRLERSSGPFEVGFAHQSCGLTQAFFFVLSSGTSSGQSGVEHGKV